VKTYTVRGQRITVWDAGEQVPPAAKAVAIFDEAEGRPLLGHVQRVEQPASGGDLDGRRVADAAIRHFPGYRWRLWHREGSTSYGIMAAREFGRAPPAEDDVTRGDMPATAPPAGLRPYIAARWRVEPKPKLKGVATIVSESAWGQVFGPINLPADLCERVVLEHNALIGVTNDELRDPDLFIRNRGGA
jgi:hypothetical protein